MDQVRKARAAGQPFYVQINPTMVHHGVCYSHNWGSHDPYWEQHLDQFGCRFPKWNFHCSIPISPCPSLQTRHLFVNDTMPKVPSWNATATGPVPSAMNLLPLTPYERHRQLLGWRNRSSAVVDLDRMIGVVMAGLEAEGVLNNTYVIFTSDNGFVQDWHHHS